MFLQTSMFPSQGFGVPFKEIDIQPMSMRKILDFQAEYETPRLSWVAKMYIMITHFLLDNPQAMAMPVCDLYVLLAYTSYLSTTQEFRNRYQLEFDCPHCKKHTIGQITLNNLKFDNIDKVFWRLQSIEISGKQFFVRIPSVREFYEVLGRYKHMPLDENSARVLFVLSCLKDYAGLSEFYEAINESKLDDIALINYLFVNMCCPLKPVKISCTKCKGGAVSVDFINKLTDLFRLISLNSRADKNKITFI